MLTNTLGFLEEPVTFVLVNNDFPTLTQAVLGEHVAVQQVGVSWAFEAAPSAEAAVLRQGKTVPAPRSQG